MVKELKKNKMAAITAAVSAASSLMGKKKSIIDKLRDKKGNVPKHGDEAHNSSGSGSGDATASVDAPEVMNESVATFKTSPAKMSSPAKIKNVGYDTPKSVGYKQFEMPAKYTNNSPIEKNFGPAKLRGFNTGGLIGGVQGKSQSESGPGAALNYGAAVGSSPAKGFWDKVKKIGGKMLDPLGLRNKLKNKAKKFLGVGEGGGANPHSHDPNTGEVVQAGAEGAVAGAEAAAPAEPAFAAKSREDYMGMDAGARKEYMGGLSGDDRATQMAAFNA